MLYLTTMRGQFLDLIGIEIGVVTEEDGAGTSLHFLHSTLPHYGLVLNTFSLGCYTSHHIQVVTFPHVPSHTLMLSCLACSRLAAVDRQTVVPSNFSSFYL